MGIFFGLYVALLLILLLCGIFVVRKYGAKAIPWTVVVALLVMGVVVYWTYRCSLDPSCIGSPL
jgi:hypothetical protein